MADKVFQIEGSTLTYEMGFEGDVLFCSLVRRLKECRLDQVTKIVQKKTSLGSGEEFSFRIHFLENGKEKKFPWIQAKILDSSTQEFFAELKERLPETVVWEDRREDDLKTAEDGSSVYDLQYLPFGYAGSGLSRTLQIWIYMICLAVLVIPLIYYIYLLATGGYRIRVSDDSLTVKKTGATVFSFEEITNINFQRINVVNRENYTSTEVLKLTFVKESGKKQKVVMRYDQAAPMLRELVEKEVIGKEAIEGLN